MVNRVPMGPVSGFAVNSTFSGATGALIILDGVEISSTELNSLDAEGY